MSNGEQGANDAERWFERYLRGHGYEYEYERDLGGPTRPDFFIRRDGVEMVCEVKAFEEPPRLERRLRGTTWATMVGAEEVYGPMRSAVREAARQLKPLAGSGLPLVVVLANPLDFYVHLTIERLIEAMYGNPGYAGRFNPEEGRIENLEFEYGRDGRLRNDHPYISAVAILRERELAREHYDEWRGRWKQGREPFNNPSVEEIIAEHIAEQEAWQASDEAANVPKGSVYWIDVLTTGSPEAGPVPQNAFDGPRDRRTVIERV